MGNKRKLPACVKRYRANFGMAYGHQGRWRQEKKFFRQQGMSDPVYQAHCLGGVMGMDYRAPADPPVLRRYPPGLRRAAFESGYRQALKDEDDHVGHPRWR